MTGGKKGPIFGFIGAPGLGKTVAMNIVENSTNLNELKNVLGRNGAMEVGVVRKHTSRPNRGADDRLKISGVPESEFVDHADNFVGQYVLTNNNAKYAYHKDELNKDGDILVAEPSIHHLPEMKEFLQERLVTILIAASHEYRKVRLSGRGTEEQGEINRRLIEGDVQIFIASKLCGKDSKDLSSLIDGEGARLYQNIFDNADNQPILEGLKQKLMDYFVQFVGESEDLSKREAFSRSATNEYVGLICKAADLSRTNKKYFDYIVIRNLDDDEKAGNDFLVNGKFKNDIMNIVESHLN